MKKRLLITNLFALTTALLITSVVGLSLVKVNADESETASLNTLVEKYYNSGYYVKNTNIYINEPTQFELKSIFHAESAELERTTYYAPDALWMSRGKEVEGVKYSYYGTDEEGNLTNATVDTALVYPQNAGVAVKKGVNTATQTWSEDDGMEGYYVTLKDLIDKYNESDWTLENNVYSSSSSSVIDLLKGFTAPCYLGFNKQTSNYIDLVEAQIEETVDGLELRLIVSETNSGLVNNEDMVFSKAVINPSRQFTKYDYKDFNNWEVINNGSAAFTKTLDEENKSINIKRAKDDNDVYLVNDDVYVPESNCIIEFKANLGTTGVRSDLTISGKLFTVKLAFDLYNKSGNIWSKCVASDYYVNNNNANRYQTDKINEWHTYKISVYLHSTELVYKYKVEADYGANGEYITLFTANAYPGTGTEQNEFKIGTADKSQTGSNNALEMNIDYLSILAK